MKKILLAALLVCSFSMISKAQFYEKDSVFETQLIQVTGEQDFSLYINITNPSVYKDYTWYRQVTLLDPSWTTAVCDPFLCHGKATDSAGFFMDSGDAAVMIMHFYMPDNSGGGLQGSVDVILKNDATNVRDTATYIIQVYNRRLSVEKPNTSLFSVYPNPSSGIINVSSTEGINEITITDLSGKVVLSRSLSDAPKEVKVDNNHLPNGLYLVRVKSTSGMTNSQKVIITK